MHLNSMQITQLGFTIREAVLINRLVRSLYFEVRAAYHGAKVRKGIRASMYRYAEEHGACYLPNNEKSIWYDDGSNDLQIALVFEKKEFARAFQTFLTQSYLNNPMVRQGDIAVREELNVIYVATHKQVFLTHYDAAEYDSPLASLEEFMGVPPSHSSLSVASATNPLVQFQSIETLISGTRPYRCHIKPQSKFGGLAKNDNNVIFGSWLFHQYFDGLQTEDITGTHNIPQIALRPNPNEQPIDEMVGESSQKLTKVSVLVECRCNNIASVVGNMLKMGSELISEDTWKTFVHVQDSKTFCNFLDWKYKDTHRRWEEIDKD